MSPERALLRGDLPEHSALISSELLCTASPRNVGPSPCTGACTDEFADAEEDWETELDERVGGDREGTEIQGWDELRKQVKATLKKHSKTLPLSQINQLLLLRNFATLRLKGFGRIAASHEIAQQWHEPKRPPTTDSRYDEHARAQAEGGTGCMDHAGLATPQAHERLEQERKDGRREELVLSGTREERGQGHRRTQKGPDDEGQIPGRRNPLTLHGRDPSHFARTPQNRQTNHF